MLHYFFLALTPSSYTCTFNTTSFWRDPFKRSHSTSWMYNACPSDVKGKCARDGNPPPRPDLSAFEASLKKCGSLRETARRLSRSRNTDPGSPKITAAVPPHRSLPRPQRHPFQLRLRQQVGASGETLADGPGPLAQAVVSTYRWPRCPPAPPPSALGCHQHCRL